MQIMNDWKSNFSTYMIKVYIVFDNFTDHIN